MRLTRVGDPFPVGDVVAQRGLLVIGPMAWPTIERWDVDTKLTPDRYTCEFGWWTSRGGSRWQAIRVLLDREQYRRIYPEKRRNELKYLGAKARGRVYLHSANHAHELEGCIAPGMYEFGHGVGNSRLALLQIFEALGTWSEGEKLTMEVS